ncbi:MAG: response regulator [Proteobacteria bacterium]|nr:response regulator [Pseudomonadota bacterium]
MPKILIIDDHEIVRRAIHTLLLREAYEVRSAVDGHEGIRQFREFKPDLVILDRDLPKLSGSEVLRLIRRENRTVPVIVFTGFPRQEGQDAYAGLGVKTFLSKDMNCDVLLDAVRRELGGPPGAASAAPQPERRILVVDDDPGVQRVLLRFLEKKGYRLACATTGREGLEQVEAFSPHLVLLDVNLPDGDGGELIGRLKDMRESMIVIVVTGDDDLEKARRLMKAGASDFVVKPLDLAYLEMSVWSNLLNAAD